MKYLGDQIISNKAARYLGIIIACFMLFAGSCQSAKSNKATTSGLYKPNTRAAAEDYAGAWLTSVERFLGIRNYFHMMVNIEHGSIIVTQHKINVMTRDFFDFQVLHLSSTTNTCPDGASVQDELMHRMSNTTAAFKKHTLSLPTTRPLNTVSKDERRSNRTLAIIAFSLKSAS